MYVSALPYKILLRNFGVPIGNRTQIEGSTNLSVNLYTIGTIYTCVTNNLHQITKNRKIVKLFFVISYILFLVDYLYVGGFSVIPAR